MSVRISTLIWDSNLPNSLEKLLLLALADWADDVGRCNFTAAELAAKARIGLSETQTILRGLQAQGTLRPIHGAPGWHQIAVDCLMASPNSREVPQ